LRARCRGGIVNCDCMVSLYQRSGGVWAEKEESPGAPWQLDLFPSPTISCRAFQTDMFESWLS
ncbi:MAG TPA: hypothetical protein VK673_07900, partial [Chthoniobacterales bacterium]|nr:hypothetical protein [Chthoniobacterales bacterium]